MKFLKDRNIVLYIVFSLLTCGIYALVVYFLYGMEVLNEAKVQGVDVKIMHPALAFLLSFVTCGLFTYYYVYTIALANKKIAEKYNKTAIDPVIIVLFTLIGIGNIVNIYQSSVLAREITTIEA